MHVPSYQWARQSALAGISGGDLMPFAPCRVVYYVGQKDERSRKYNQEVRS